MNHIAEFQKDNALIADGIIGKNTLQKMRCVFGIQTDAQLAHYLANTNHETGQFTRDTENLNYSESRLLGIFKHDFDTNKDRVLSESEKRLAKILAYKPERIANFVYANQNGNGSEASGDGWKYRGRGALQLTGKDNYKLFSDFVKDINVMLTPDVVATKYFWESAMFYFERNHLWNKMKGITKEDVRIIRKAVNGGANGLDEVQQLFTYYYNLITK